MVFCLNKLFDLHSPPKSSFSALQRSSWRPLAPLFNGARRPNGPPARASSAVSLHTHTATDRRPKLRLSSQSGQGAATGATDDPWWEDLWLFAVIRLLFENTSVTVVCSRFWRTWELGLTQNWSPVDILSLAWFIKLQQDHDGDIS